MVLATQLGSEFLPALEEGNLWIRATLPPTISLEAGDAAVTRMREIIMAHPEVITVTSQHGRPDDGSDASGFNNVELFCPLKPFDQWPAGDNKAKLIAELQRQLDEEFVGTSNSISRNTSRTTSRKASRASRAPIRSRSSARTCTVLERLSRRRSTHRWRRCAASRIWACFHVLGQPNLNVRVDRAKAARYGLNTADVTTLVQAAMGGTQATTVLEGDRQFALTVRFAPQYRDQLDSVRQLTVGYQNSAGGVSYVPLAELADISLDTGASYIYHERNERLCR